MPARPRVVCAGQRDAPGGEDAEVAGEPRFGVGGVALAEFAGAVVERVGELAGDGRGAGGGALGPRRRDGRGRGGWRRWRRPCRTLAMDRAPSSGAAVIWSMTAWRSCPARLGGAQRGVEGFAGVFPLVPPCFGLGEPGGDLLVDLGVHGGPDGGGPEVEQVPGSAGPFLGLPDGLGGRQLAGVAFHDVLEHGFGGGLLVGLLAGRCGVAGDDVGGVGFAAAAHADVQGLPGEGVGDQEVGGVDGAALGDVHVAGVAELGAGGEVGAGNPELSRSRCRRAAAAAPPRLSPRMAVILRVSRLVSFRPAASISVLSRARIRSPGWAWFPSASGTCAWYPPAG